MGPVVEDNTQVDGTSSDSYTFSCTLYSNAYGKIVVKNYTNNPTNSIMV